MAQKPNKSFEVGIFTSHFDDYGVLLKYGNEKSLFRFSLYNQSIGEKTSISNDENTSTSSNETNYRICLGKEYRMAFFGNVNLYYGIDLAYGFGKYILEINGLTPEPYVSKRKSDMYKPGLANTIGLNGPVFKNFLLSIESGLFVNYRIENKLQYLYRETQGNSASSIIEVSETIVPNLELLISTTISIAYRF